MAQRHLKFGMGFAIVIATGFWLAVSGFDDAMSYYIWADELVPQAERYYNEPLRVAGFVVAGSIERSPGVLKFEIERNGVSIPVVYTGTNPVPDTFKDGANAVVEGEYHRDGHITAHAIQAKCASKYESDEMYESGQYTESM